MSWRGKYISWYRIIENTLDNLVPNLKDFEIMENVTPDNQLITPSGQEHLPINLKKPIPKIALRLSDENAELSIIYDNLESLELLRNIFRHIHEQEREELFKNLRSLPSNYETLLYINDRDKKQELLRKYITARIDLMLLENIIEEMLNSSRGGVKTKNHQSIYVTPKTPNLYLTRVKIKLNEDNFIDSLSKIKPIYRNLKSIKTQREIISDNLRKPKTKRNMYREFIKSLNEARKLELISAEKRREFNKRWREKKGERESLMEQLNKLLETTNKTPEIA